MFTGLVLLASTAQAQLSLSWTNNLLTISGPKLPGGKLEVWYLEAFCRSNSANRNWGETKWPHKTKLISSETNRLTFQTELPGVEVSHEARAGADEVELTFELQNRGTNGVDVEWFQPACIRVERFTGCSQTNYIDNAFIFTERGLTPLSQTHRTEEALYRGGQVYVPAAINLRDANPRPICRDKPVNGLIGCFSADRKHLLATASSHTHELFEGVYVCLHSDPHVHGLAPGETKKVRCKIYVLEASTEELLRRYKRDFGGAAYW